jgi:hypothetical protein
VIGLKRKILVYWDYRRKDLLLPFIELKEHFDFVFIYFRDPAEDPLAEFYFKRLYWKDYKSGLNLLQSEGCDSVLFMELSNLYSIALNYSARTLGKATYWMDHGIKLGFGTYVSEDNARTKNIREKRNPISGFRRKSHTLKFYFSSLRKLKAGESLCALKLLLDIFISGGENPFLRNKFKMRKPFRYILFSEQNFQYYLDRDGALENEITYIGNPYFDQLTNSVVTGTDHEDYYLLIDEGILIELPFIEKAKLISKLNQIALNENTKLYVKLHPVNYDKPDIVSHINIIYLRESQLADLINNARKCFGFSSTIVFPLLASEKIILFNVNNEMQKVMKTYGVQMIDYSDFRKEHILNYKTFVSEQWKLKFEKRFLYKSDGRACERLKIALQNSGKISPE